jgi:CRISPR/Cas system CSM-associated protein Csm2 small subunit
MVNGDSTMGLKEELLKKALELKLKKATATTKEQIQKLYQKVDELTQKENKDE